MYIIKTTRKFYGPRKTTKTELDEKGTELMFASRKEAAAWIAAKENGAHYFLGQSEYCSPMYRIVKV